MRHLAPSLALLLSVGCANVRDSVSTMPADRVFTAYSVSYEDADRAIEASAQFLASGPAGGSLWLDGKASVEFDGESLGAETSNGVRRKVRYRRRRSNLSAREVWTPHSFKFVDATGKTHAVEVGLASLPALTLSSNAIALNDSLTVTWSTPEALAQDELFLRRIADAEEAETVREDVSGTAADLLTGSFTIPESRIRSWGAGNHKLQLCRARTTKPGSAPKVGGSLEVTTCTATLSITVSNGNGS